MLDITQMDTIVKEEVSKGSYSNLTGIYSTSFSRIGSFCSHKTLLREINGTYK